jgi:hypothetical protein
MEVFFWVTLTSFGKMLSLSFSLLLLINLAAVILAADRFSRGDFPPGFVFGSGTSAYQVSVSIYFLFVLSFSLYPLKIVYERLWWRRILFPYIRSFSLSKNYI